MAVDRTPVLKRCRSLGLDPVFLGIDKKSNRSLNRSNRKKSEYGLQLCEKQKAKFIYGVLEKPFRNYYAKAERMKIEGNTEDLQADLATIVNELIYRKFLTKAEIMEAVEDGFKTMDEVIAEIMANAMLLGILQED